MKRLLVAARSDLDEWAAAFREALPDHDILTRPPQGGDAVAYAVVGRPQPGLLRRLGGLELVLSLNAGIETLLAGGEVPDGVPIVRLVDPGLTQGMVEWVAAQVLAWHRNLFAYAASQAEGRWAPRPERLARERTAVVLGAGALGAPVGAMLARLGFLTRVWSRSGREVAGATPFAGAGAFAAALTGADILVNLLPLTQATRDILDAAAFRRLAPGAFLVNAGRGGHLVDRDLIEALDLRVLGAAALDVFRDEPLPAAHPFWTHPAIRISPHVAAPTQARTAVTAIAGAVRRHERGEPLSHLADRETGY